MMAQFLIGGIVRSILLSVVLLLLFACKEQKKTKIAFIATFTGKKSELGLTARHGLEQFLLDSNWRDHFNIEVFDDGGSPEQLEIAMREAISNRGIKLFLGPLTSNLASTVLQIAKKNDILVMSPVISTDAVSGIDDSFLRVISPASNQADVISKIVLNEDLQNGIIVLDEENIEYTGAVAKRFKEEVSKKGGKILDTLNIGKARTSADYAHLAQRISSRDVDYAFIISSSLDAARLCQQVRKRKNMVRLFGSTWTRTDDFIFHAGRAGEGFVSVGESYLKERQKDFLRFKERFFKNHGAAPTLVSIYTYDASKIFLEAVRAAGDSPYKVKDWIIQKRSFQGIREDFVMDRFGDVNRTLRAYQVKDGVYKPYK